MPVLVVAAAVLGTWYLSRRWQSSGGPAAAQRVAGVLRWVWRGCLALLAVVVLAAMAQGCDGAEDGPRGERCAAFHPEDCATGEFPTTTTTTQSWGLDLGEPRYEPCPAFHEEDCPPAP